MASSRMQRCSLTLLAYEYELFYRPGLQNDNADSLSRLSLRDVPETTTVPGNIVHLLETINSSPVDVSKVKLWTARDPVISQRPAVYSPWMAYDSRSRSTKTLFCRERVAECACRLCSVRFPCRDTPSGHESHPGIKMKNLCRNYAWWPRMDTRLDEKVKSCQVCQSHQKTPPCSALHPWEWPCRPWSRILVDYAAGPFIGNMFLLIVDAHSKWMNIHCVISASSSDTVEKMRATFATHGLPDMVVSDNGSCFTSSEIKSFLQKNGIKHVTSAPYHPASNGLVEGGSRTNFQTRDEEVR